MNTHPIAAYLRSLILLLPVLLSTGCVSTQSVSKAPADPPTLATVPASLQATAGNAQVSLTWSGSNGATSYHVKRSTTSGGPYSQIAAPTSAAYTDTTVTNGSAYFYVVSALNSAGESANSTEASATPAAPVQAPAVPTALVATAGTPKSHSLGVRPPGRPATM